MVPVYNYDYLLFGDYTITDTGASQYDVTSSTLSTFDLTYYDETSCYLQIIKEILDEEIILKHWIVFCLTTNELPISTKLVFEKIFILVTWLTEIKARAPPKENGKKIGQYQ